MPRQLHVLSVFQYTEKLLILLTVELSGVDVLMLVFSPEHLVITVGLCIGLSALL